MISMENDKSREPSDSTTAEFILISCVLAILFCVCCWVYGAFVKVPSFQPIRIEVVESDKMLGSNYISKEEADSLIGVMKRQERMLEDKYQYALDFLEKRGITLDADDARAVLCSVCWELFNQFKDGIAGAGDAGSDDLNTGGNV